MPQHPTTQNIEQKNGIREKRRRELLDAACELFAAKGYEKTNVSDIAARAGVSQGTIYWYFKSKDELLLAVFEDWLAQLAQDYVAIVGQPGTTEDRLRRYARAAARRMQEAEALIPIETEFWTLIFRNDAIRERFGELFRQFRADIADLFRQGVTSGELRSDINPDHLAAIAIAVYDGLVLQWAAEPQAVDWFAITETFVDVMLNGGRER